MYILIPSVPAGGGPGGQAGAADDIGHCDGGLHGGPRHLPHPGGGRARWRHIDTALIPNRYQLVVCEADLEIFVCEADLEILMLYVSQFTFV